MYLALFSQSEEYTTTLDTQTKWEAQSTHLLEAGYDIRTVQKLLGRIRFPRMG